MVRGAMAATRAPSSFWRVTSWVGTHLLAVATIAGFIVYGFLRVSYATFYGRFDVEPEEVGLGQTEILTQSGLFLFVYVLFIGVVLGLAFLAYRAIGIRPVILEPDAPFWRRAVAFTSGPYWMVVIPTVLGLSFLVLFELPVRARTLADQVERGETVRPSGSFTLRAGLHVKAVPVRLTTLGGDELPSELRSPSLLYLGQASGVLIVYDWEAERVIRLPMDSVVMTTSHTGE
jgi:hypothetical protein